MRFASVNPAKTMSEKRCLLHATLHVANNEREEMDISISRVQDSLLQLLSGAGCDFHVVEHPPVYTIEEAMLAVPPVDGIKTKNIFVRDAKGNRHILVIVPHDKQIDLGALAKLLPSTKLSMGSAERLQRCLGVIPGAVSLFSLINDVDAAVELVVDEAVWQADRVQGHPLRNTATVSISHASLVSFLAHVDHRPKVIHVPSMAERREHA